MPSCTARGSHHESECCACVVLHTLSTLQVIVYSNQTHLTSVGQSALGGGVGWRRGDIIAWQSKERTLVVCVTWLLPVHVKTLSDLPISLTTHVHTHPPEGSCWYWPATSQTSLTGPSTTVWTTSSTLACQDRMSGCAC